MGKNKDLRNVFKESIDPRFSGLFNSNKINNAAEKCSSDSQAPLNVGAEYKYPKANENVGFQNFIGTKLTEYLDKHIKEVDRPVSENDFFANKTGDIRLFSASDVIYEDEPVELIQHKPAKKKKKKKREDESFKEVAVSYEWLQKQAEMLKS